MQLCVQCLLLSLSHSCSLRWYQQKTTGQPPLGVRGGACCAIGNKIYYFGGYCNHDNCKHNSLHELDTGHFKWSLCLASGDSGPTRKSACGMVVFHQTLLVVGGIVSPPVNSQPLAQYDTAGLPEPLARSNEHHLHNLGTGALRAVMIYAECVSLQDVCVWLVDCWRIEDEWGGSGVKGGTSASTTIACLVLVVLYSCFDWVASVTVGVRVHLW